MVESKGSESVHGVNAVDHVQVWPNHAAAILLAVGVIAAIASMLHLLTHAADDVL